MADDRKLSEGGGRRDGCVDAAPKSSQKDF
jgi:hypothetical protein